MPTFGCALYCKLSGEYSALHPVYAMWTCGPVHIQFNNSSAYSGLNIQQKVSALVLEISRQFNARYTANLMPNIAHIPQFTLWELWPRTYTMYLHLRIFRLQYATERICAAIDDISTIQCAIYCKLVAKYSAHPPDHSMWTVVPAICNVVTALHIQALIFNWTYLRWYWRYVENSMRHILQTWCQMQRIYSSLRYVNCAPEIYNAITVSYNQASIFNLTDLCCHWRCLDNSTRVILQTWCQIQTTSSTLRCVNCGPGHMQCSYSSAYSGLNIQLNLPALLLEICRQFNARYTANMVPNIEQILQFTLSELRSRTYTM
jgi:hypothetical protein